MPRRPGGSRLLKDVTEFLASIELNTEMGRAGYGGNLSGLVPPGAWPKDPERAAQAARSVPGLKLHEMQLSDICCGSAGIYNVLHTSMALALLRKKWMP